MKHDRFNSRSQGSPSLGELIERVLSGINRCVPRDENDDIGCGGCNYGDGCPNNVSFSISLAMLEDARAALTAVQIRHKQLASFLADYAWPPNIDSGAKKDLEKYSAAWLEVLNGEL